MAGFDEHSHGIKMTEDSVAAKNRGWLPLTVWLGAQGCDSTSDFHEPQGSETLNPSLHTATSIRIVKVTLQLCH